MPRKKRRHGHHKMQLEQRTTDSIQPADCHADNRSTTTVAVGASIAKSQPRQITPLPVTKGSSVKPVQFETPLVSPSPTPAVAGATVIDMPTAGKSGSPKERAQTAPTPSKVTTPTPAATKSSSAGVSTNVTDINKPRESPKGTAQSVAVNMSKADTTNVDTTKVATPAAAAAAAAPAVAGSTVVKGKPEDVKQPHKKVQVEVAPPVAKSTKAAPAVDPFDALASSLPSETLVPPKPMFIGPEVKEPGVTSEKGVICGGDDSSLPPGYRFPKTAPAGIPEKPKNVPKPLSTNEALDALSAGFSPAATPKKEQVKVSASAGFNFAPPPPAHNKAPADKKARIEAGDTFSLMAGLDAPAATKPKTDEGDPMSLDALSALGDTLAAPEPVPELPKLKPEDMVTEDKLKAEKGVLVGERENTLPPKYRFKDEKPTDLHPQKPEPSMDSGTALDILSGDFKTFSAAPPKQLSIGAKETPRYSKPKVEDISALDALAGDFVAPPQQAFGVHSSAPPSMKPEKPVCSPVNPSLTEMIPSNSAKKVPGKPTIDKDDTMSLDALSALGNTLAGPEPVSEPTKLRPEDFVTEDKLKAEKGVRVGEREETLAPKYRFKDDQLKDLPPHKPEPSMDSGDALDILSGDFMTSSAVPAVHAAGPVPCSKEVSDDFALDTLADDFVAPAVAPAVKSSSSTARHLSVGTVDALDALSDTLTDTSPTPESAPVSIKDMVKEKTIEEEKLIKMGERDDSLPPEHRPTEADKKAMAKAKADAVPKQKSMDDKTALDLLSGDFSAPSVPIAASKQCASARKELMAPVPHPGTLQPLPGPALDSLARVLLPDTPEFQPKEDKPKSKSKSRSKSKTQQQAEDPIDHLSGQLSSDVVQASSTPKGGKT